MLVLGRKPGEVVRIGREVRITVLEINPEVVFLGVEAPGEVRILRAELRRGRRALAITASQPSRPT